MGVSYEWDRELVDSDGDIIDHNHSDKVFPLIDQLGELTLVRDELDDSGSVLDRMWAYVQPDGKLPQYFSYPQPDGNMAEIGIKVPQRFHDEIAVAISKHIDTFCRD